MPPSLPTTTIDGTRDNHSSMATSSCNDETTRIGEGTRSNLVESRQHEIRDCGGLVAEVAQHGVTERDGGGQRSDRRDDHRCHATDPALEPPLEREGDQGQAGRREREPDHLLETGHEHRRGEGDHTHHHDARQRPGAHLGPLVGLGRRANRSGQRRLRAHDGRQRGCCPPPTPIMTARIPSRHGAPNDAVARIDGGG